MIQRSISRYRDSVLRYNARGRYGMETDAMARASSGNVCQPAVEPSHWASAWRVASPIVAALVLLSTAGCAATPVPSRAPTESAAVAPLRAAPGVPGDPNAGRTLFATKGCAGCHTLQHVPTANGAVGPNLTNVVLRPTLGGDRIENTAENMARWIMDPPGMKSGATMPNLGLNQQEARDIAAFLFSHPYNPAR